MMVPHQHTYFFGWLFLKCRIFRCLQGTTCCCKYMCVSVAEFLSCWQPNGSNSTLQKKHKNVFQTYLSKKSVVQKTLIFVKRNRTCPNSTVYHTKLSVSSCHLPNLSPSAVPITSLLHHLIGFLLALLCKIV